MESGSLFNSGFLGSTFLWWIGQIADDSTWRDNQLPGKFPNKDAIPGWGQRYKVRIMGVHDQGQAVIKDEDLPWCGVLYPVTAGGGQTNSWMSSNLRQGNFVFGFYLDGQNMQSPIILGVIGNNSQTELKYKIGAADDSGVSNTQPGSLARSGYSTGAIPKQGAAKERVPDEGLVTEKPKSSEISKESAPNPPGAKLNQYGLADNRPVTQTQANDIAAAKLEASEQGLTGEAKDNYVKGKVKEGITNRAAAENSPNSPSQPGVTQEHPGALHQLSAGDVKKEDKYREKEVLLKPGHIVEAATKAIQTETDNYSAKVDKYLGSRASFIDAVSGPPSREELDKELKKTAKKMAKYQKIIMEKLEEYQLKKLNQELTVTVSEMPSSMRYMFGDQKFLNTEDSCKKYNEMTNKLSDQLESILKNAIPLDSLEKEVDSQASSGISFGDANSQSALATFEALQDSIGSGGGDSTSSGGSFESEINKKSVPSLSSKKTEIRHPKVPVCYAEDIVAQAIAVNKDTISKISSTQHENYNRFIQGIKSQLDKTDQELAEKAYDRTNLGKVVKISDEEEDDLPIGGTNYYSENGAPCTGGTGTGLKVDIIVPDGGWYDNSFATINDEGAGYTVNTADGGGTSGTGSTTGASVTGGSGTGLKLNYTISGGKVTGISTNTVGSSYKNGDVLTIVNNASGTPSTNATFTIDKVRGVVNTIENGGITIADPGSGYTMGDLLIVQQSGSGLDCGISVAMVLDPGEKKATAGPVTPADTNGSVADSKPNIGQKLGDMLSGLPNMVGNLTEALDFKNVNTNIFPFETPANIAVSDFYTLGRGGASQGETEVPSASAISKAAVEKRDLPIPIPNIPFAEPTPGMPDIDLKSIAGKVEATREQFQGLTEKAQNELIKKANAKAKDVFNT